MGALDNRIALVTGASQGIGAAVAERFAQEGAQVIALARNVEKLEALDDAIRATGGLPPALVPLDLREGDAIDRLGALLYERYGRLDILLGNAGVLGELSPLSHIDPGVWDDTIRTNLTANWRLIRSMDPLLRQSEAGRVLFVTSGVTKAARPYWGPYHISKVALEALAHTYAAETEKTSIRVHLVDPGIVSTAMRAAAFPGETKDAHPAPGTITDTFVDLARADSATVQEKVYAQA